MKAANIHLGELYAIKISGKLAFVEITSYRYPRGFDVRNQATGRTIVLHSAARLRWNETLRRRGLEYYADLTACRPTAPPAARANVAGDFEGCEAELNAAQIRWEAKARPDADGIDALLAVALLYAAANPTGSSHDEPGGLLPR
jgi:hypothetical protein